jgi:hypothetical protein
MVVAVLVASAAAVAVAGAQATPLCFGAAARDPQNQPCDNPALRLSVVPKPSVAQITPSAPCRPLARRRQPEVCAFGRRGRGRPAFALVGDSHAEHWRGALEHVARERGWRGLTLARSMCPFTTGVVREPGSRESRQCATWTRAVIRWFRRHREIHTVFVGQRSHSSIRGPNGERGLRWRMAGYRTAWNALPRSVEHIVVLRDPPHNEHTTLGCVERAMARRKPAGTACALPRNGALNPDSAVHTALQMDSPRVDVIDLSDYFCGARRCFPVIGGVLVRKDIGHLTRLFAETLAPFLGREIDRLLASWSTDSPDGARR